MQYGFRDYWSTLGQVLEAMLSSPHLATRVAGAKLACLAVYSQEAALPLAQTAAVSTDAGMRKACVDVLGHNLELERGLPWTHETFLALANDPDEQVYKTAGYATFRKLGKRDAVGSADTGEFLTRFLQSRAFLLGPSTVLNSLMDSPDVLPESIFKVVGALIARIDEPGQNRHDRLFLKLDQASQILKRLYHENRETEVRRKALDLIDVICTRGALDAGKMDE
jgi:hypothetical protein